MKRLFTIFLTLSIFHLLAQEQFNNLVETNAPPNGNDVFALSDTGYAIVGVHYYNSMININIVFTDEFGEYTNEYYYGDVIYNTFEGAENACIKTEDGYLFVGSKSVNTQDTCMIYIVKFDEHFDTLWTKIHFWGEHWVIARGICNTDDGGFMVVGETQLDNDSVYTSSANTRGLMLKLDSEGNYQWFKSYGTNDFPDWFYKVVQTPDGGYLVGGATNSWQEPLWYPDLGDWYVVKTDSQGNEEWSRTYGSPDYDDGRITDILKASDTTYYISGGYTYNRNQTGSVKNKESYIVKLDKNYNEVYELKYDEPNYYFSIAGDLLETSDSNIVVIGQRLMGQGTAYEMRTTIHKITPEGDLLWQRQYVADNDTNTTASYGMSIKQTADGGYVFGGWAYGPGMSPSQQMWLVKTDSMGCDGTGDFWDCSTGVTIKEFASNPEFYMYPNPASDYVFVVETIHVETIHELSLQQNTNVEIYNLTGKLVKSFPFSETENGLNISDLESGIYIVKIGNETQKLIIE